MLIKTTTIPGDLKMFKKYGTAMILYIPSSKTADNAKKLFFRISITTNINVRTMIIIFSHLY